MAFYTAPTELIQTDGIVRDTATGFLMDPQAETAKGRFDAAREIKT